MRRGLVDWWLIQSTSPLCLHFLAFFIPLTLSKSSLLLCPPETRGVNLVNREAKIEFGEAFASKLKLSKDGTKVLWPQPTDSPNDPLNWSDRKKALHLLIITLAAIVPDFDSGIGRS